MKLRHVSCSLAAVALIAACAAQQDIVKSVPDVAGCVESAVTTFVTGTPDIEGLIAHCGATVADIEKVITDLQTKDGGVDGSAGASPERAAKIAAWKDALVKYKAAHPSAK